MTTPPARPNLFERRMSKFLSEPPSIRLAASVIVSATVIIVVAGGVLIRSLDHHEYSSIWIGMWWALQTVTTVGYGDVTPQNTSGRIVGALVMLEGIAFVAIITAAITSTFVARAARESVEAAGEDEQMQDEWMQARFDDIAERLDRIEARLG